MIKIKNLLLHTNHVGDKSKWNHTSIENCTATFNHKAPGGSLTATEVISTTDHRESRPRYDRINITPNKDIIISIHIKQGSQNPADKIIAFCRTSGHKTYYTENGVTFDLYKKEFNKTGSNVKSKRYEILPDGWMRIIWVVDGSHNTTTQTSIYYDIVESRTGNSNRPEIGSSFQIWGSQLEQDSDGINEFYSTNEAKSKYKSKDDLFLYKNISAPIKLDLDLPIRTNKHEQMNGLRNRILYKNNKWGVHLEVATSRDFIPLMRYEGTFKANEHYLTKTVINVTNGIANLNRIEMGKPDGTNIFHKYNKDLPIGVHSFSHAGNLNKNSTITVCMDGTTKHDCDFSVQLNIQKIKSIITKSILVQNLDDIWKSVTIPYDDKLIIPSAKSILVLSKLPTPADMVYLNANPEAPGELWHGRGQPHLSFNSSDFGFYQPSESVINKETITDKGWLSKYKSCTPGIRFNVIVYSPEKPVIILPAGKSVTIEQIEPGVWSVHTTDKISWFKINGTNGENTKITKIDVLNLKDISGLYHYVKGQLSGSFEKLPNIKAIHFHELGSFNTIRYAFKNSPKLVEITGINFKTITDAKQTYYNTGIKQFMVPGSELFNLQNTVGMFQAAKNLQKVTDFSEVLQKEMAGMFQGTTSLEYIKGLNTTKATDNIRDIFKGSSVKVPNSVYKAKLIAPGGFKFFTQNFNPIFEVKVELDNLTDDQPIISTLPTEKNIAEKTPTGYTYKSWEPVERFWFRTPGQPATSHYQKISKIEIIKADLKSLKNTFFYMKEAIIPNDTIKNVNVIDGAFAYWRGDHLDISNLIFSGVTSAQNLFYRSQLVSIKLPNFPNVVNTHGMFHYAKKLEYINQIAIPSTADISVMFANCDELVAPNKYEIKAWRADRSKALKATIPYPFVAVGTMSVKNGEIFAIGDSKQRPAPGIQIKSTKWQKAQLFTRSFNIITTGFKSFNVLDLQQGDVEIRFLYPIDFIYFEVAQELTVKDPNVSKIKLLDNSPTNDYIMHDVILEDFVELAPAPDASSIKLEKIIFETPKLDTVVLMNEKALAEVSISSNSLVNANHMFQGSGPLSKLNIPTENIVHAYSMFYASTIKTLENFIFPKMKFAHKFAQNSKLLKIGAQFPNNSLLNIENLYDGCINMEFAGYLKTSGCTRFNLAFNNTPKLLCLKELDTRKAPADKRNNIFGNHTKMIHPNSAERLSLKNGDNYLNKTPCPILEQVINLPQQTKWWNLDTFVRSKLLPGSKKVKIINGLTQPGFNSGALSGLDTTFINSGSIQAVQESGTAVKLEAPLKIINTGTIYGGGGHGGSGGKGAIGSKGQKGSPGIDGSTGKTTPEIPGRGAIADRAYIPAYNEQYKTGPVYHWGGAPGSVFSQEFHMDKGKLVIMSGWWLKWSTGGVVCVGFTPANNARCVNGMILGSHYTYHFTGVSPRLRLHVVIMPAGSWQKTATRHHPAVPAIKGRPGVATIPAEPGCPGGPGGEGGPGGRGGNGGASTTGGHGQYWKHPAEIGNKGTNGGIGHDAPDVWSNSEGKINDCGSGRNPGGKGTNGTKGSTGSTGYKSGYSGAGGMWGHAGHPGESGSSYRNNPGPVGAAGKAIEGKQFLKKGSTGLTGAHIAGSID